MSWFESTLQKTNINGEIAYKWSYTPNDSTLHYIENSAHGSSDVEGMYVCYKYNRCGISTETMRGFANTALLLMNKGDRWSSNVGGYGADSGTDYPRPEASVGAISSGASTS